MTDADDVDVDVDVLVVGAAAPGGMWFLPARVLEVSVYWWFWLTGILNSPSTSRVSRAVRARGDGSIGRELQTLVATGEVRMVKQRVVDAHDRIVVLADGTLLQTDAVLWCTGYRPDYDWLRVPGALDARGGPSTTAAAPQRQVRPQRCRAARPVRHVAPRTPSTDSRPRTRSTPC